MSVQIFAQEPQGGRFEHVVMVEKEEIFGFGRNHLRSKITSPTGAGVLLLKHP